MKSAALQSPCRNSRHILINTRLPVSLSLGESERFYTEMFNIVVRSLPLAGNPVIVKKFDDIGPAIEEYESRFDAALLRGDATPEEIFSLRQASSLLKKLELPVFERAGSEKALEKWYDSEAACKEMNEVFKGNLLGTPLPAELETVIVGIRKEISVLLGDTPPDLPDIVGWARFGPGSSTCCPYQQRHPLFQLTALSSFEGMKLEAQWILRNTMVTEAALTGYYGMEIVSSRFGWRELYSRVEFTDVERYVDVPKSIDGKRSIGVGPNLSTFVAQGYDHELRQRLRNWGIDLTNQELNQELARQGSLTGDSCTMDLSEASNRFSLGLVHAVLPAAWFGVLYPLRAPFCEMPDGSRVRLEKFSSMGNSLTFSLMTLILSALIRYVLRKRELKGLKWRVYGDDLVVPYQIFDEVSALLRVLGLKLNTKKSYNTGSFRESCGHDYFAGVNVRPLFIKKPVVFVTDLYKYFNLTKVVEERNAITLPVFSSLREYLVRYIPETLRLWGEPSKLTESYLWLCYGMGPPSYLVETRTTSVEPARKQAYIMRLYAGGSAESLVRNTNGRLEGVLYPHARVSVNTADTTYRCIKRKPSRKAWEALVKQVPRD